MIRTREWHRAAPSDRIKLLVDDIARLQDDGAEVVFVSSGAMAAGQDALGIKTRPQTISDLHMAAAVGQMHLMSRFENLIGESNVRSR